MPSTMKYVSIIRKAWAEEERNCLLNRIMNAVNFNHFNTLFEKLEITSMKNISPPMVL